MWVEPSLQPQHILSPRADFFPLHQLFILLSCRLETSAPIEESGWHLSSGHSTIILDTRFVSQEIIDSSVPGFGAEAAATLEVGSVGFQSIAEAPDQPEIFLRKENQPNFLQTITP